MTTKEEGVVYSAYMVGETLGTNPPLDPFMPPEVKEGTITLYYPGSTIQELRKSHAGQQWFPKPNLMDKAYQCPAEPGYYRLQIPAPGTEELGQSWKQKMEHLQKISPDWGIAPVSVATLAMLMSLMKTGQNPLGDNIGLCRETGEENGLYPGFRMMVRMNQKGKLTVDDSIEGGNRCRGSLPEGLIAAQKIR